MGRAAGASAGHISWFPGPVRSGEWAEAFLSLTEVLKIRQKATGDQGSNCRRVAITIFLVSLPAQACRPAGRAGRRFCTASV